MTTIEQLLREYENLPEFVGSRIRDINQMGGFGSTPLHIACYRAITSEVDTLISAGADVNARGEYGERPLQAAIKGRQPRNISTIIELLLRHGALCELYDDDGRNAWQTAEHFDFTEKLSAIVQSVSPK